MICPPCSSSQPVRPPVSFIHAVQVCPVVDGEAVEGAGPEKEARDARGLSDVHEPTAEEVEKHSLTHLPIQEVVPLVRRGQDA